MKEFKIAHEAVYRTDDVDYQLKNNQQITDEVERCFYRLFRGDESIFGEERWKLNELFNFACNLLPENLKRVELGWNIGWSLDFTPTDEIESVKRLLIILFKYLLKEHRKLTRIRDSLISEFGTEPHYYLVCLYEKPGDCWSAIKKIKVLSLEEVYSAKEELKADIKSGMFSYKSTEEDADIVYFCENKHER